MINEVVEELQTIGKEQLFQRQSEKGSSIHKP